MNNEKRHFTRIGLTASVGYRKHEGHSLEGSVARDISERGMKIHVREFIPPGTVLELQFILPVSSNPVMVKGKVVWVREVDRGEFWELGVDLIPDKYSTGLIREFLASRGLKDKEG